MPSKEELISKMRQQSNEELLDVLAKPENWSDEAVEAAKELLQSRNVNATDQEVTQPRPSDSNPASVNHPKWKLDWADAAVPFVPTLMKIVLGRHSPDLAYFIGESIGSVLVVFLLFAGVRQIIWTVNRRRPEPKPRKPLLAFIVGSIFWLLVSLPSNIS
jgi:hypothetical protein